MTDSQVQTIEGVDPDAQFLVLNTDDALALMAEINPTSKEVTKIKVPSGAGTFFTRETLDGDVAEQTIVVAPIYVTSVERAFYAKDIADGSGKERPDCSSRDGKTGYGARDIPALLAHEDGDESLPQSEQDCSSCALGQFESAMNGGDGKACSERRRIFGFVRDEILPVIIQVPTMSVAELRKLEVRLLSRAARLSDVAIEIGLTPGKGSNDYSVMTFKVSRKLTPVERERFDELRGVVEDMVALESEVERESRTRVASDAEVVDTDSGLAEEGDGDVLGG